MRLYLIILGVALISLTACTDNHSEKLIEGDWHAAKLLENKNATEHQLPEGIKLNFEYPKYSFEGNKSEHGNYYIKNDKLHLLPEDQGAERGIDIMNLSKDSLALELIDSLGTRTVYFVRNRN